MDIRRARQEEYLKICNIVEETISNIYPKYYPDAVVKFFLEHHSEDKLKEAFKKEIILVAEENNQLVATGALEGNNIKRIFVLPPYQGRGIGKELINTLENLVLEEGYATAIIDSSIPAFGLYFKLSYQVKEYNTINVDNGQVLSYHVMSKNLVKDKNMDNPFLYDGAVTKVSSINRLILNKLPLVGVEDSIRGMTAYDAFSTDLLVEEIIKYSKELGLQLDNIEEKDLPICLSKALQSKDLKIKMVAEAIAEQFGKRLGLILLTLKKGELENRVGRKDWEDKHWDYWAKIKKVILDGGLASGLLGERLKYWVDYIFNLANEKTYQIILADNSSNSALVGCSTYIKSLNSVNLVFDFGQSFIKRGVVTIKDGVLYELKKLDKVPAKYMEWEIDDVDKEKREGYLLHEYLVNVICDTYLEADNGQIGSEIVISIANYVNKGKFLDGRGGYAKLAYLGDNYEKCLGEALSKKVKREIKVKLVHDGTAAAASFTEYNNAVCITLGTAFGVGFL